MHILQPQYNNSFLTESRVDSRNLHFKKTCTKTQLLPQDSTKSCSSAMICRMPEEKTGLHHKKWRTTSLSQVHLCTRQSPYVWSPYVQYGFVLVSGCPTNDYISQSITHLSVSMKLTHTKEIWVKVRCITSKLKFFRSRCAFSNFSLSLISLVRYR